MTDDAAVADLPDGLPAGDLEVVGFPAVHQVAQPSAIAAQYGQTYGAIPTYFPEVIAAVMVITQAASGGDILHNLRTRSFDTILGSVRFVNGERAGAPLSLWRPNALGRLEPQELLVGNEAAALQLA